MLTVQLSCGGTLSRKMRYLFLSLLFVASLCRADNFTPVPSKIVGPGGSKISIEGGNATIQPSSGGSVNVVTGAVYVPTVLDFSTSVSPLVSASGHSSLAFNGTNLVISLNGGGYITLGGTAWGGITGDPADQADLAALFAGKVATTRTVNGHALSANVSVTASDLSLGSVENTALSTWAGSANITTLGTIGTGTWNATAIADGRIASALTGKTYNGLTITSSTGTLTIPNGITLNAGAGGTIGALGTLTPGTGVATALAVNVGSAGAPVLFNGAGGTPSSLTLTNATGLPAAGVTGTSVTQTTLSNATLPGSFTTLAASAASSLAQVVASTAGNQHTITSTFNGTITFDTANVLAIRHTKVNGDGASAIAYLRHSDGFEMGAAGYKNVGSANTYLDGAIYLAGGIYNSSTGASASSTPPKIIIGQEWSGGGHVRMQFNTDRTIIFAKESGVFHTLIGADGGWQIGAGAAGATATSQFLDVMGNIIVGNYTDQSGRNTVASGWAFSICDTGANLLKLVRANVGGVDIQYNGSGATRTLDFVDEDGATPLKLLLNGAGNVSIGANIICSTAGKGLQLKSGTGARAGNATLVGGTVTVTNTTVTANSIIYCGRKTPGGTLGQSLSYSLSAGTSFTITSVDATGVLSALDTSVVSFIIVELN